MTDRALRAVLIGVDKTEWVPGQIVTDAIARIVSLGNYLGERFTDNQIRILTSDGDAKVTKRDVAEALASLAIQPSDTVLVAFFGHGIPAFDDHPYHAWALSDLEEFSDREMFDFINRAGSRETVIVSTCCFARGFLEPGRRRLAQPLPPDASRLDDARLRERLAVFARGFGGYARAGAKRSFILLSAAAVNSDKGGLDPDGAPRFLDLVQSAATAGARYLNLRLKFWSMRAGGRNFYVDARPRRNLLRHVLGT